jgi:Tol biopolymer transport system component
VLDFGLAKLSDKVESGERESTETIRHNGAPDTAEGTIVGTVSYMSPEQAEGKKLDARSDIFSFGALLYEMVTGRRAFQGDSKLSTLSAILREEPKPASQVVEGIPRELERIIGRCLRKNPERRFQTMADLKVALEELKEESDSGTLGAAPAEPRRHRLRSAWVFALVTITSILASALWFVRSSKKAPDSALTASPLTTYPGFQREPSFSPDGNQVAFSWNGEKQDNFDIYVKLIGTAGPPLRITNDPGRDYSPAWSKDGRHIAFLRDLPNGNPAVLLVPALGGPERNIGEVYPRGPGSEFMLGPYLSWSQDGKSLVVCDRRSTKEPLSLYLLSIESGEKRRLTSPPAQLFGDSGPTFSPDGRTLAFTRIVDFGACDLYVLSLSSGLTPVGEPKRLTFGNWGVTSPSWTADGHAIVFANLSAVGSRLWRIDLSSTLRQHVEPRPLSSLGSYIAGPAISRDGSRLAFMHQLFHASIVRVAASESDRSSLGIKHLISSSRDDMQPQFSPDGREIAFISSRSGTRELWVCNIDGSNAVQLTSLRAVQLTTPRWSPDGKRIVFDSNATGEFDIYATGTNGGTAQRITTHPANDGNPSWSHDGGWIYFDSARTGEQQIFKIPASGGEPVQITHDGGFAPVESVDGKFVYFTKGLTATSLWKIPAQGGQASKLVDGLSSYINLAVVSGGVYFVPLEDRTSIRFLSFTTNTIKTAAKMETNIGGPGSATGGLTVSPDGRWILCVQVDQSGSELMLVENFR